MEFPRGGRHPARTLFSEAGRKTRYVRVMDPLGDRCRSRTRHPGLTWEFRNRLCRLVVLADHLAERRVPSVALSVFSAADLG